jgi:hypothetical protein
VSEPTLRASHRHGRCLLLLSLLMGAVRWPPPPPPPPPLTPLRTRAGSSTVVISIERMDTLLHICATFRGGKYKQKVQARPPFARPPACPIALTPPPGQPSPAQGRPGLHSWSQATPGLLY